MRRFLRGLANQILKPFGLEIIRAYEYIHITGKYRTLIQEVENFFSEFIFSDVPTNSERISLLEKLYGTQISEALYIVHFLHKSMGLAGDVCEFGVANGATSALLGSEIKNAKKKLWLFDSFKGLSVPTDKDILINDIFGLGSMGKYGGTMAYPAEEVKTRLLEIKFPKARTKIISGFIENTIFNKNLPKKICFAYVDFDLYQPTLIALDFIDQRLPKGGIVIVDDYNFFSKGAKTAVDEFVGKNKKRYRMRLPYKFAGSFCVLEKIA